MWFRQTWLASACNPHVVTVTPCGNRSVGGTALPFSAGLLYNVRIVGNVSSQTTLRISSCSAQVKCIMCRYIVQETTFRPFRESTLQIVYLDNDRKCVVKIRNNPGSSERRNEAICYSMGVIARNNQSSSCPQKLLSNGRKLMPIRR
jgi:hypothetical protein